VENSAQEDAMDDKLYREAIANLEQLKKARHQALELVKQCDERIAILETFIKGLEKTASAAKEALQANALIQNRNSRKQKSAEIERMMDSAENFIIEKGHPLTRSELLEYLEKEGFRIEAADRSKVLGTNLWRSKRFHNLKGAGYWPKSKKLPPEFEDLDIRTTSLSE